LSRVSGSRARLRHACRRRNIPTGCAGWPRSRPPAAPSTRRREPSSAPPGDRLGKRQVEELAARTAVDFDDFYATRKLPPAADPGDVLALSADGKGIVMRPEALRPATARAAPPSWRPGCPRARSATANAWPNWAPSTTRHPSCASRPTSFIPDCGAKRAEVTAGPTASNKWLTASVVEDAASVVHAIFDEAERRDPNHTRAWVALVDGANHQIDRIRAEAKTRGAIRIPARG
jgi:hypothetical protein